jgi:hypothetical protein
VFLLFLFVVIALSLTVADFALVTLPFYPKNRSLHWSIIIGVGSMTIAHGEK